MAPRRPGVYKEDKHEIGEGCESEEPNSDSEASDASGQDEAEGAFALIDNSSSRTSAIEEFIFSGALDMESAIEVGLTCFRNQTDHDDTAIAMYNDIKQEARPDSKKKTTLTPWIGTIRKQMKAIHV